MGNEAKTAKVSLYASEGWCIPNEDDRSKIFGKANPIFFKSARGNSSVCACACAACGSCTSLVSGKE